MLLSVKGSEVGYPGLSSVWHIVLSGHRASTSLTFTDLVFASQALMYLLSCLLTVMTSLSRSTFRLILIFEENR